MERRRGTTSPGRSAVGLHSGFYSGIDNSQWIGELVTDLIWPRDLETYQKMRRSDHQVEAILRSIELPIEQGQFAVRPPPDASAEEQMIAETIEDAYLKRIMGGWTMAVRCALTGLQYGFNVLEETWMTQQVDGMSYALPYRFDYRPQISITGEMRANDETLTHLMQTTINDDVALPMQKLVVHTVGRLTTDQWRGTSLLRSAYKAWLLKDQAERITAIGHQRWSAGIPSIRALMDSDGKPVTVSTEERQDIISSLQALESDDQAFLYVPSGFEAGILDRRAGTMTPLDWVVHLGDAMARAILALHLTLGGATSGSRSLGTSFIDVFLHSVQAWGDWVCDGFNEQSIRQVVDFNWGPQERYPQLAVRNVYQTALERLGYLMQSGVVRPTEPLERYVYESLGIDYEPGDIGSQQESAEGVEEAGADEVVAAAMLLRDIQARLDKFKAGNYADAQRIREMSNGI